MKEIYKFGEAGNDQWYELDGKRVKCGEEIIDKLFWQWVKSITATRFNDGKYTIFEVKEPIYL
jgi:hypothetical protein